MPAMVTIRLDTRSLAKLTDPKLIIRAEEQIVDRGIGIFLPLAKAEAPSKTGTSRNQIQAISKLIGGHPVGTIHTGRAYPLRILSVGAAAHDIGVFRFKSVRRSRRAARALGPGRARGAVRTLRFAGLGGDFVFRRNVRHPGLRRNPFMERAALRGSGVFTTAADVAVQHVLDQAT